MKRTIHLLVMIITSLFLFAALTFTAASCGQETVDTDKLGIIVTLLPQAEFAERVGGDKVDVTVMVPPGASPHTYEPTPSQMTALSRAALYAKVGSGVEFELTWMDKLTAQNEDMLVVDCSRDVTLQEMAAEDEHADEDTEEHEHGAMDPHIWMSPRNVQIMVRNIAEGLISVDPDNREYYEQNRDAYLATLAELDEDIRDGLTTVQNRVFMVYHPAFGYFASCYDLTMLPIEAEGKEATAAGLQRLIDQAVEHDIKAVFAEPQFDPHQAEVIAEAIGGRVILIDPLAEHYVENMRSLMGELVEAME